MFTSDYTFFSLSFFQEMLNIRKTCPFCLSLNLAQIMHGINYHNIFSDCGVCFIVNPDIDNLWGFSFWSV